MSFELDILGQKEVVAALDAMEKKARSKLLRQALRAAAKPIRSTARALAPVEHDAKYFRRAPGTLRNSIKIRKGKKTKYSFSIGVFTDFFGEFVEYGHIIGGRLDGKFHSKEEYKQAGLNKGRKFVEAKPFLRPAFDEHKESSKAQASQIILDGIQQGATQ